MSAAHAYWFFGNTLRDGRPIPADGEWLEVKGSLELCVWGLHASLEPFDALFYAPGPNLALVELDGDIVRGDDKLCASRRRIITRIDATAMLRSFARQQALSVIHLWDAPPVVRAYLETGDEALRGAAESASAARVAALSARSVERAARAATWAASVVAAVEEASAARSATWAASVVAAAEAASVVAAVEAASVVAAVVAAAEAAASWAEAQAATVEAARAAGRQQFNSAVFQHMARAQTRIGEMS